MVSSHAVIVHTTHCSHMA